MGKFETDKMKLVRQVLADYFENEGIFGYDEDILSILEGKPNYRVNNALAEAVDTYPSDYTGWQEDSEYEMLSKFLEWNDFIGYTDPIWQRFEHPGDFLKKPEVIYQIEVVVSPAELREVKFYPVEIVSRTSAEELPRGFEYVEIRGDRESLLGVVRMLQDGDVELFGGDYADDDEIVEQHFTVVKGKTEDALTEPKK